MENADMEDKKVGAGMLVLVIAAVAAWALGRKAEAAVPPTGILGIESLSDLIPGFLPGYQTEEVIAKLQKEAMEDPALYAIHLREAQGLPPDPAQRQAYYAAKTGSAELGEAYAQFDLAYHEHWATMPSTAEQTAAIAEIGHQLSSTAKQVETYAVQQWWSLEKTRLDPYSLYAGEPAGESQLLLDRQREFAYIAEHGEEKAGGYFLASTNPEEAFRYYKGEEPAPAPAEEAAPAPAPAEEVAAAVAAGTIPSGWTGSVAQLDALEQGGYDIESPTYEAAVDTAYEAAKAQADATGGVVTWSSAEGYGTTSVQAAYSYSYDYGGYSGGGGAAAGGGGGVASGGWGDYY